MPGFLVGTTSTSLAGTIGEASSQHSRHIAVPARLVFYVVLFIIFVIVLLAIPVIWGAVAEACSSAAEKAAPGTFFLGLGVLFTGLVAGLEILDIVGASLVGLVVIGVIVDNYLAAATLAHQALAAQTASGGAGVVVLAVGEDLVHVRLGPVLDAAHHVLE